MKPFTALAALTLAASAQAQVSNTGACESLKDDEVAQADSRLNDFIRAGDAQSAADLYALQFVLTSGSGARKDRARMLMEIGSPELRLTRNETEDVQIHREGCAAVLTGVLHQVGSWQGRAFDVRLRVTDTWVFSRGRWVLLAGHASVISPAK